MGIGLFICCNVSKFDIGKITSCFIYSEESEIKPLPDIEKKYIAEKIFSQKFYFLGSGRQYYTFLSEDEQYVLKFFKMSLLHRKGIFNDEFRSFIRNLGLRYVMRNQLLAEKILNNYRYVYDLFREEIAVIYLHLDKTFEFPVTVTLIDDKGKKYFLDLNSIEFIVQKRARKIYDHLNALVKEAKYEDLAASLRSFFQLISIRCKKGFVDQNLDPHHSFGFIDNTAVQFDCATLSYDPSIKYPSNYRNEVLEIAERLQEWAREHCPEAALFIQEEAQKIVNHSLDWTSLRQFSKCSERTG